VSVGELVTVVALQEKEPTINEEDCFIVCQGGIGWIFGHLLRAV
jgi:hypothetical protein